MNSDCIIETLGYILKEENLVSIQNNIIPDTLILEAKNPFPGYHGKYLPEEFKIPEFVYFVTKEKYTSEHVFRVTRNVQKYFDREINVARSELTIHNTVYPSIRIKGCKDFTRVNELISCYKSEGFRFVKSKPIDATGLIKVQKTFSLVEKEKGIYFDKEESKNYYIEVPYYLNFEQFRKITTNIKNNIENSNFDAAQAMIYRKHGVVDLVRIFEINTNLERLKELQYKYENEIHKLLIDKLNSR
jgi:hypothetical protein